MNDSQNIIDLPEEVSIDSFNVQSSHISLREEKLLFLPNTKFNRSNDLDWDNRNTLLNHFENWCNEPLYMAFGLTDGTYRLFQCMKRGNAVYEYKIRKRINTVVNTFDEKLFEKYLVRNENRKFYTNSMFISLTFATDYKEWDLQHVEKVTKKRNRHRAWKKSTKELNLFLANLRKQFGRFWCMRSIESTQNGYPHFHLLIIFLDRRFECFSDNNVFRIKEKEKMAKYYHSFIDVKACESIEEIVNYLIKDIFKQYGQYRKERERLSLALGWLYRKQSFSISGNRIKHDLIRQLSIIQTLTIAELEKEMIKEQFMDGCTFLGLVTLNFIGRPPPFSFSLGFFDSQVFKFKKGKLFLYPVEENRV